MLAGLEAVLGKEIEDEDTYRRVRSRIGFVTVLLGGIHYSNRCEAQAGYHRHASNSATLLGLLYRSAISISTRGRSSRSVWRTGRAGHAIWGSGDNDSRVAGE